MLGVRTSSSTGSSSPGDTTGSTRRRSNIRLNRKSRDDDDDINNYNNQDDVIGSDIDSIFRPGDKILVEVISFGPMVRTCVVVVVVLVAFALACRFMSKTTCFSVHERFFFKTN